MEIDFARGRWSPATQESYAISWVDWTRWCEEHGVQSFPGKGHDVAAFLRDRAETLSTSTLSGRLAAIIAVHQLKRRPIRVKETEIRDVWAEIRRTKGTAKTPKRALGAEDAKKIVKGIPADLFQQRAALLVAFASAMRRSELVALDREDVAISDTGMTLTIRRSKTDKAGKGETVGIGRWNNEWCPVAALERWLEHAKIEDGPIFRTGAHRMHPRLIATWTKRWGKNAGYDPAELGAHSWRRGCITTMHEAGVDLKSGMMHSRHKTPQIYLGYVEAKQAMDNPAVKALQIA